MRTSGVHWKCVLCGKESTDIICWHCADSEKSRQRAEAGSITKKQFSYIEYLMSSLDTQTTSQIIYGLIPEYDGDLENISMNKAGALISKLVALKEEGESQEPQP